MGALTVPQQMRLTTLNARICARIGVIFNGNDMGNSVIAYSVKDGTVLLKNADSCLKGVVKPYWR